MSSYIIDHTNPQWHQLNHLDNCALKHDGSKHESFQRMRYHPMALISKQKFFSFIIISSLISCSIFFLFSFLFLFSFFFFFFFCICLTNLLRCYRRPICYPIIYYFCPCFFMWQKLSRMENFWYLFLYPKLK